MSENKKPLEGIRLIELANYVAAPIVGRIAADLGAEVIKIEGRGGDAWRATSMGHTKTGPEENPLFDIFNVGKKSISLNMKSEEGKEIFFKLLEGADILITNTRNQSLVKLGVDYESIKDRFPRLIYATLTGYGYEGPDCNAPGFDNIAFWSRSGFSADMSFDAPGSYPTNSRYAMGDVLSGTTLFGGVMTALYQRERTGKGDFVTMSLYNAGIWMSGGCIVMAEDPYNHEYPEKRNSGMPTNLAYRCSDGEWVRCTIFEYERYADKFFDAIGVTEIMADMGITNMAQLMEKADVVVPIYEKAFIKKSSAEWLKIFSDLDIVSGRLFHFADVLKDEQAWANQYLQTYKCGNGAERVLPTCPVRLGSQGALKFGAPVLYGEHNRQVLADLGYSEAEIDAIIEKGALS
ncbi:MAG: CoA transferase [Oscillospiraceae bacterium]|nr:CoA transferase [Oscillospiraceae bacterium]